MIHEYTIITERVTPDGAQKWDLVIPNGPHTITEIEAVMFKLKEYESVKLVTWEKYQQMLKERK
jgi:hypothetical protein